MKHVVEELAATTNPWKAAELLGLPPNVPLVVVVAQAPEVARHAFVRAEQALRGIGLTSAWRLLPAFEIGVVSLPNPPPSWTTSPRPSRRVPRAGSE